MKQKKIPKRRFKMLTTDLLSRQMNKKYERLQYYRTVIQPPDTTTTTITNNKP